MPANSNQSGTWTPVKTIFGKTLGVWKAVRRAFVNIYGTWTQFFANNTFEVYALGLSETAVGGGTGIHGLYVNGTNVFPGARSYNLVLFDNYGNITSTATYDVFDNSANAGTLAAALGGLAIGQLYLIFSYDEPNTNDTANGLPAALTTLFGGNSTIVSSSIPNRGAYLAMGYNGQAPVLEQYCGTYQNSISNPGASTAQSDAGCADGALVYKFQIWTTEQTPGSPHGNFANLAAVYTGGNLVSNPAQTGGLSVPGLPFS
jgi:hypothetical protein